MQSDKEAINLGLPPRPTSPSNSNKTNVENTEESQDTSQAGINSLSSLKNKNTYLRKAFTLTAKLLTQQMESNVKQSISDNTYAKLTGLSDELSNATAILLTLPEQEVSQTTLTDMLKQAEKYDTTFSTISEQYLNFCSLKASQMPTPHNSNKAGVTFAESATYNSDEDEDESTDCNIDAAPVIKFQPLKLPRLSGDPSSQTELMSFMDWLNLFMLSVTKINSKALKQAYLLQSLDPPAADLVRQIPCSDTGFDSSLKILSQNFGNVKKNIQLSIKRLVEYQPKPIQQGTATSVAYRKKLDRAPFIIQKCV